SRPSRTTWLPCVSYTASVATSPRPSNWACSFSKAKTSRSQTSSGIFSGAQGRNLGTSTLRTTWSAPGRVGVFCFALPTPKTSCSRKVRPNPSLVQTPRALATSLRRDLARLDELREALRFGGDEFSRFLGGGDVGLERLGLELVAHFLRAERVPEGGVQARHDLGRGSGGREEREPLRELEVLEPRLAQRGHVRQEREALRSGHGERAQRSRLHVRQRRGERREAHVHLAAEGVRERGAAAAVGDMQDEGVGGVLEHLRAQVERRADARRGVGQPAGIGAREAQQLLHVARL